MITKFSNSIFRSRMLIMRYILCSGFYAWDSTKQQYVSAPNYMLWNSLLLGSSLGLYPTLLTIHLVNKYLTEKIFDEEQPGKIISYIIGWAENALCLQILVLDLHFEKHKQIYQYVLNQLFTYDAFMTSIHKRNGKLPKKIKDGERLLVLMVILVTVLPISFVAILTVDADETHNLIKDWLEIDLKWEWKHAKILFVLIWGASSAASVVLFGIMLPFLYLFSVTANLEYLMPVGVCIDRREEIKNGQIVFLVRTKGFGILPQEQFINIIRTENVVNRLFAKMYKTICLSAHHLVCLVLCVVCSFLVIREGEKLAREGFFIILLGVSGVTLPVLLEYFESTNLGMLSEGSWMILEATRKLTPRKAILHKFAVSCEILRLDLGHPFYNVDRHTFLEFIDEAANMLFTLLAI